MGEVVEAEQRVLGYRVIVKLLREEHFARFELKNRMRLEAHACMRIRHENLVRVVDAGETLDGRTFLVMERLHGRTFRAELDARGHVPVAEALAWIGQVLAGLGAAHAAGVLHRDVKPENLFLCELPGGARRVKVLDFGVAKIIDAASAILAPIPHKTTTGEGFTVGTPRYFSPEQARADRDLDARSDICSVGWVLYELLTGKRPFHDRVDMVSLTRAHALEMPPPPSVVAPQGVPAEVDRVVMKALAKRREERFASAEELRQTIEKIG
jgi:serine/threonine-protein kinase